MKKTIPFLFVLVLFLGAGGAYVATAQEGGEEKAAGEEQPAAKEENKAPAEEKKAGEKPVEALPVEAEKKPAAPVEKKIDAQLQEFLRKSRRVEEIHKAYARNYYLLAKKQYDECRYEEAKENLKIALRYNPELTEAERLLEQVQALLGERPSRIRTFYNWARQEMKVKIQQKKIEMENLIAEGEDFLRRGEYRKALEKFDAALQIHRWLPFHAEFPDLKRKAQGLYDKAKAKAEQEEIEERKRRQIKARQEALKRLKEEQELERRRIEGLFERLKNAYYNKSDFELAERLAEEILDIDPNNKLAWEWRAEAREKKHNKTEAEIFDKKKEEERLLQEYLKRIMVPQTRVIEYPENWLEMVKDREAPGIGIEEEPPWKTKIKAQMQKKVSFDFIEVPLEEVIKFLTRVTDITIVLDPAALVDASGNPAPKNVTLRVDNMRFEAALNWILRLTNLKMALKDEAIFIGKDIDTETVLKIYDIRDLTIQPQDMPGPNIELTGGTQQQVQIQNPLQQQQQPLTGMEIKTLIEKSVAPQVWNDANIGAGIDISGGKLVITAPERVHELVQQLLDNFRQQNVLQVNVLCRFLDVDKNFMDDIGIQINSWNTASGELPGVDNIFTPYGQGEIGTAATVGMVGASSTEYSNLITPATGTSGGTTTVPGLWFDYAVKPGNIDAQFTLHAVEGTTKSRTVAAPRLTVFNNQRAHILMVTQHAYVRDVTPVTAQGATSFDPELDTYTTGVVLDVRPTVSSDRKYITLEIRPTRAQLYNPPIRRYYITGSGGSSAFIEMPEITVDRVRTNAVIPDGGTIILGGMSDVTNAHERVGVPFLSHIPFIGRLFGHDFTQDRQHTTLVMVSAKITLFKELEAEL